MPDVGRPEDSRLLRALARDYCPDSSQKVDIVERLVEVGRKASRCSCSTAQPFSAKRIQTRRVRWSAQRRFATHWSRVVGGDEIVRTWLSWTLPVVEDMHPAETEW